MWSIEAPEGCHFQRHMVTIVLNCQPKRIERYPGERQCIALGASVRAIAEMFRSRLSSEKLEMGQVKRLGSIGVSLVALSYLNPSGVPPFSAPCPP